jgi:hypothetical protein
VSGITVPPNGITVICKHSDTLSKLTGNDYIEKCREISNTVVDYKSLGCAAYSEVQNYETFYYKKATPISIFVNFSLVFDGTVISSANTNVRNAIIAEVKQQVNDYLMNLKLGEDILYTALCGCVFNTYKKFGYTDFAFALSGTNIYIGKTSANTALTQSNAKFALNAYEYITKATINISVV